MRVIGFASAGRIMTIATGLVTMRRGLPMAPAIIPSEKVKTTCDVAGASHSESDEAPFAKAMKHLPAEGRFATAWIAATMLAMTWASETQSSPDHARHLADAQHAMAARNFDSDGIAGYGEFGSLPLGRDSYDKSVHVAQATTGDAGHAPEREHHWAETLSFELTIARRDIELLQRLEQEYDRAERLGRALAAARREVETQTALADKASDEACRLEQARGSSEAELQRSLQQERERSARLEQDLATARREVETQTALASKASEDASRLKQAGESSEARLQKSLQEEGDRAERLEQDLAAARRDVEIQTALAAKASEEASRLDQARGSSGAELQQSLQQERERSAQLEQDLAAARREVETQTALAAKASEEASRLDQVRGSSEAELQQSLQQERQRYARLEQELAAARRDVETQTVLASKESEEMSRLKQASEKERKRADALAQDLSIARSAIYAYEAQARRLGDEVAELRQAAANGAPSVRDSAQDGRNRTARLEQDLVTARRDLDAQAALAARASEEVARSRQVAERDSASLRSSLQQERARAEQLERGQDVANAPSVGPTAQNEPTENAKSVDDGSPAAGVRSDARPNSKKAAVAALLARASALLRQGNIGAARIVLERAVEMGSVQASFSLAETYDPLILAKWGTLGTRGDPVRAQDLYAKADAAGIKEAKARIEALRR
jgi:hypothetical protein